MKHKSRFAAEDIRITLLPRIRASSSLLVADQGILTCINCQLADPGPVAPRLERVPPKSRDPALMEEGRVENAGKEDRKKPLDIETDEDGFVQVELTELEKDQADWDLCD